MRRSVLSFVMPALVAGVHVFLAEEKDVDGRNKSGHDGNLRTRHQT
jgi:hypothetical protein